MPRRSISSEHLRLVEQTDADIRDVDFEFGSICACSCRSPGKATPNEDAIGILPLAPSSGVLVVADGCGGHRDGEVASRLAIEAISEAVCACTAPADGLTEAILSGFQNANERILALGSGAATTLAVVEVQGPSIRTYHVGDSIILVMGQRGRIRLQTTSHSPTGYAVEAGLLDEAEAIVHEDRHVVSNLVGTAEMSVEVGMPVELNRFDTLLIASDGLSDNLHTDEVIDLARKGALRKRVESLIDHASRRMVSDTGNEPGKPDDISIVVFRPPHHG